jgi:hypothetical protein
MGKFLLYYSKQMRESFKNIHFNEGFADIIIENEAILVKYADGIILTMDIVIIIIEELKRLSGVRPFPVIWDISGINYWTRDAREFMVRKETTSSIKKMAIIYSEDTPLDILINFFRQIHKPAYPVESFKNNREAINWINTKPDIHIPIDLRWKYNNFLNISCN